MFDLLVLNKLKNQSTNLSAVIDKQPMNQLDYNFIITLRESMTVDVSSIIFSNHFLRDIVPLWYILRLDRDKLELLEIKESNHTSVVLYFHNNRIFFNGKEHNDLLRHDFKKRLKSILIDLHQKKCRVYEEKV